MKAATAPRSMVSNHEGQSKLARPTLPSETLPDNTKDQARN
jgi:hypothetical protein